MSDDIDNWLTAMAKWRNENPAAAAFLNKTEAYKKRKFNAWWLKTENMAAIVPLPKKRQNIIYKPFFDNN